MNNILLIEDDELWTSLIKEDLRSSITNNVDINLTISKTFQESNIHLDNHKWKLILVDIGLSPNNDKDKSGLTLIRKAVKQKFPLIIVSDKLTVNDQTILFKDTETIKYLKGVFSKEHYNDRINDFINTVKETLLEEESSNSQNNIQICNYELDDKDKFYIIDTIEELARSSKISSKHYFKNLVEQLDLPERWQQELSDVWLGDTWRDSTKLINWIQCKNSYPKGSKQSGKTVLGNLLKIIIEKSCDPKLVSIIIENDLITDREIIDNLAKKYCSSSTETPIFSTEKKYRWDVFLSHSSADKAKVRKIASKLNSEGLKVWLDEEQIDVDDGVLEKIEEGLTCSKRIIVSLSPSFGKSGWCRSEYRPIMNAEISRTDRKRVIVLVIEDVKLDDIPIILQDKYRVDYNSSTDWKKLVNKLHSP